jgi:hypothetical protein
MTKPWFEELGFRINLDIQYIDKPFITSFIIRLAPRYNGEYKELAITIFPRTGKVSIEHFNKGELTVAQTHVKYNNIPKLTTLSLDHIDIPDYLKRVLKTITNNTVIYDNLNEAKTTIKNTLGLDQTPFKITHKIEVQGAIWDENKYGNDLGKIDINEYIDIDDVTEYQVSQNWFIVQKDQDGELITIEREQGKETYNPFDQEILDNILPTKEDFENLVKFAESVIREGIIEFPAE